MTVAVRALGDPVESPRFLRGKRRGENELDAGLTCDEVQGRIQLFGERANHAGA